MAGRNNRGHRALREKLTDETKTLQRKVKTIKLQPAQIANGSVELLNEELTPADRRKLSRQIDSLAEPLSTVATKVSGA